MEKILTIVIPTYNMEKYLRRCLDSLIIDDKELLNSLEVLVVNDGSKDSSSAIAHEYQEKFQEIFRVIDKENGNYGSCVNRGLKEANGKYIKILDSDDYVIKDNFVCFIQSIENVNVDLIVSNYDVVDNDGHITRKWKYDLPQYQPECFMNYCDTLNFKDMQMHAVAYRKELLLKMDYEQTEGISFTDQEWMFYPMCKVSTFYYIPCSVYQYVVGREGQTVADKNMPKVLNQHLIILYRQLNRLNDNDISYKSSLFSYLKYRSFYIINHFYRYLLNKNEYLTVQNIDDKIKTINGIIYNEMNGCVLVERFWPFKYIKLWRNHQTIQLKLAMLGYEVVAKGLEIARLLRNFFYMIKV